ncbi:MAG: c-type cytochrome biogenesis protein CcmI [Pseudomonadota bacterium]
MSASLKARTALSIRRWLTYVQLTSAKGAKVIAFWAIVIAITACVVFVIARTGLSARADERAEAGDVEIYKAQLREVDRDVERGTLSEADAEALRTEIARRLLAADAAAQPEATREGGRAGLVLAGLVTGALGVGLYAILGAPGYGDMPLVTRLETIDARAQARPRQVEAERAFQATVQAQPEASERHLALVADLRAAVLERPDDLRGLALLARNEALLGNFRAAISAQEQIIRVKGESSSGADFRDLAELMVVATAGYVSPEAEAVLLEAAQRAPRDGPTRYYLGLMHDQSGRFDQAFAIWQPLLEESAPGDPWVEPIRAQIPLTAQRAGIRYVLPEGRGPSADDLEAAMELTEEERAEMIMGMVQGLANRLATQGGTPEEWARLITAQVVLGDRDRAQAILDEARGVFAERADAMRLFAQTAIEAGLE